ncbi:mitochondrial fission ELM1-domain-containing protein [Entophlyctis helioformis]|nr:mitochondrial fission ELM1-domain-containing protein [Entophlyctis helioformis]
MLHLARARHLRLAAGRRLALDSRSWSRNSSSSNSSNGTGSSEAWIMSAGNVGRDKQAVALAAVLGLTPKIRHVVPSPAIKWMYPVFQLKFLDQVVASDSSSTQQAASARPSTDSKQQQQDAQALPWFLTSPSGDRLTADQPPAVVISSCADTTLPALTVKRMFPSSTKAVHLLQPLVDVQNFDVCVLPRYLWPTLAVNSGKGAPSGRVVRTDLTLNSVTPARLGSTSLECIPQSFRDLPADRVVTVLVSGEPSAEFAWYGEHCDRFIRQLSRMIVVHPVKVLLTFTDRTPAAVKAKFAAWHARLTLKERVYIWDERQPNPYDAMLAYASDIVVLADSTTMTSEAICSGRRTYVAGFAATTGSLRAFHVAQLETGRTRVFRPAQIEALPASSASDPDAFVEDRPAVSGTDEHGQLRDALVDALYASRRE